MAITLMYAYLTNLFVHTQNKHTTLRKKKISSCGNVGMRISQTFIFRI